MKIEFTWPNKVPKTQHSRDFIQRMLNRVAVGFFRYGDQRRKVGAPKMWERRARLEIKAYEESGNSEHLVNAANYMMCAWIHPEHPNHHFKHESKSATRGKV